MPALLLLTGPSAGLRIEVKEEAVVGRSPSCQIALEDAKVSRRHARIRVEEGQTRISDLGSRNGTVVNGERVEGEAILLPGDRVQVGDTTILYQPPVKASLAERDVGEAQSFPLEEVLPGVGPEAALYSAGVALLSATSEAVVLRRAAEELGRAMNAERAAALLGGMEGLLTAAVVGAKAVEVPRSLMQAALERKQTGRAGRVLCAPLTAYGGMPFGVLHAERPEPFGPNEHRLAAILGRLAGEALAEVRARAERERPRISLLGSSQKFRQTVEQARRAAAGSEPVVLWGEAGSGKLLLARYIHSRSSRALGPLVEVDCRRSALAVEEELFGRQSGPGVPPLTSALIRADGGTLVVRHVEVLPRHAAERLAQLLAQRVAPAGQGREDPVGVRVIATSSSAVHLLATQEKLDRELAQLLSGSEIELLPLRERQADVPGLFESFAAQISQEARQEPPTLSPEAKRLLEEYHWPGNVRELRLLTERLAALYPGKEVVALKLPPEVQQGSAGSAPRTLAQMIARLERDAIAEALREAKGKKIRAAALLGISRPTLDKKIGEYQLVVEKVRRVS